jgi:hypothetical protein
MLRTLTATSLAVVVLCLGPAPAHSASFITQSSSSPSAPAACPCLDEEEPGVIWRGTEPIGLAEIAHLAAPALWFSRDEPLLKREGTAIPKAHPCDDPSTGPVAYYQVTQIAYRGGVEVGRPEEDDPDFFEKVDHMILKYFFYYPEDFGLGGHLHDLEAVEFQVDLEREAGCYQLQIEEVTALAHGNRWYSNNLEVTDDTKFPMTIIVEEGKHGSATDRNADGYFTRGYDINQTINDASGVRDVMGSGVLLSSGYNPEMTKPRRFEHRVLPPETELPCVSSFDSSLQISEGYLARYDLRPGNRVPRCAGIPEGREHLYSFMRYQQFGEEELPDQYASAGIDDAFRNLKTPDRFLSVSLRGEGALGVALVFRGLDLRQGWVVPKINVNGFTASGGLMYTPSASRFFDWYLAGGLHRQYETITETIEIDAPDGRREIEVVRPTQWNVYWETGIKLRARVPGKARPFVLGYSFAGLRVGVQALGIGRLDDIRLIVEIGAGAW